ncbi:hypothetical protein EZ456_06770 [Pedobacter psychrodurus]|uniref:Uncharacterized protein n=1 Tax=Pedobacter psychrodurus TaxID=2530456 RepID=A0A4R0Q478_9SPHI|nr:hypothetical protein [Pedobacter psychrodurus]TCD28378.1 hypothetical protein EZ456_06770 [Pedobacter psychrodurus]
MKNKINIILFAAFFLCGAPYGAYAQVKGDRKAISIAAEIMVDKIRGGLLGQIIGNINGMPHEFKYFEVPGAIESYRPALPDGGITDDDTDFEWVYIYQMQKSRNAFIPYKDINALWTSRINRNIWCANRFARHLMDLGFQPPLTGNITLNPWAEFK